MNQTTWTSTDPAPRESRQPAPDSDIQAQIEAQLRVITQGALELIGEEELRLKLERFVKGGRPLVVKLGLDPSAPDIHLGHAVVLRKIRQFQDLGHRAVIIFGDFTGMIGDPTGRSKARRQMTHEEVLANAATYQEQIFRILRPERTEVRFNSEWLSALRFGDVVKLAATCTVARMLERDDFEKRFRTHEPVGIHEFFYPLMQGYDSVALEADIELGGSEQRFNILMGRTLQKEYDQECQAALFMPLLEGLDGVEKMSKSLGNTIGIHEPAIGMFEKAMTVPDALIPRYFGLATDISPDRLDEVRSRLADPEMNPRDVKLELAHEIVRLYHGAAAADHAREEFLSVFSQGNLPEEMPEFAFDGEDPVRLLFLSGLAPSGSEARRLLAQGAVRRNGERLEAGSTQFRDGDVVSVGKRKFLRILKG